MTTEQVAMKYLKWWHEVTRGSGITDITLAYHQWRSTNAIIQNVSANAAMVRARHGPAEMGMGDESRQPSAHWLRASCSSSMSPGKVSVRAADAKRASIALPSVCRALTLMHQICQNIIMLIAAIRPRAYSKKLRC